MKSEPAVVGVILNDQNQVLVMHRHPHLEKYPDIWYLPGGKVEEGEDPCDALMRELREEIGVEVEIGDLIHETESGYGKYQFFVSMFLVRIVSGEPQNLEPHKHDIVGWYDLKVARDLQPRFNEAMPMVIEKVIENL